MNMRNIKLILEYDGTDFCGWQLQPSERTVQGELERALSTIFKQEIRTIAAGRTDSGVHARGQVANFPLDTSMPLAQIRAALNGTLAKDMRIMDIAEVDPAFNARFDAIKREYCYRIARKEKALERHYTWYVGYHLDVEKIRSASTRLVGIHDFRSFCRANANVNHYRCTVEIADWTETGHILSLRIIANRFLHSMVRTIVGTMIEVGRGKWSPEFIQEILDAQNRHFAGPTAPARGLCLERVYYNDG
ncbi:tRNA pseudouridine(38-40) synthase TruA [candidate division KSB1 bacterium]|nr:tRNA pseudouridine(38-40) synthase TruA [candidate division KSB1 bacterium]